MGVGVKSQNAKKMMARPAASSGRKVKGRNKAARISRKDKRKEARKHFEARNSPANDTSPG